MVCDRVLLSSAQAWGSVRWDTRPAAAVSDDRNQRIVGVK